MPRESPGQQTFNGGEISSRMEGRSDIPRYAESVSLLENMVVLPGGPARRRPGTRNVDQAKDSTVSRLLPFQVGTSQYIVEVGAGYLRFYKDGAQIVMPTRTFNSGDVHVTEDEIEIEDHGYLDQTNFQLTNGGGGLPAPLLSATDYYVKLAETLTFSSSDITVAPTSTIAMTAHGLSDDMGPYRLSVTPAALTDISSFVPILRRTIGLVLLDATAIDLYIEFVDADTIALREAKGGARTEIGDTGSATGTFVLTPTNDYLRDKFRVAATPGGAAINITTTGGATPDNTITPRTAPGDATVPPYEVVTPYVIGDLGKQMQFAQTESELYIVTKDVQPQRLTSTADTKWSLDGVLFLDGPYLATREGEKVPNTELTPSGVAAPIVPGDGNATLATGAGQGMFTAADIGRIIRLDTGTAPTVDWGWAEIVGLTSANSANLSVKGEILASAATLNWNLGVFKPLVSDGWPNVVGFFDQRLAINGGEIKSANVYASKTGEFSNFEPTDRDADVQANAALNFHIVSNQANRITWISTIRVPVIGTEDGIFIMEATGLDDAITPTNLSVRLQTAFGANRVQPIRVDDSLIYVSRTGNGLRLLAFNFEQDAFRAQDIGVFADHLLYERANGGVNEMAHTQNPHSVLWICHDGGQLSGITMRLEQQVVGWHQHTLGGGTVSNTVNSIAAIPSPAGDYDQLWLVNTRLTTSTRRSVDFLTNHLRDSDTLTGSWVVSPASTGTFFLDAGVRFGAVTTVTGLDHLEGETVTAIYAVSAGGIRVETGLTVASGQVVLNEAATSGVVGLPYTSNLETLPIVPSRGALRGGSDRGLIMHVDRAIVSFDRTIGGQMGDGEAGLKDLPHPIALTDQPPLFFTGEHRVELSSGTTRDPRVYIRQSQPYPLTVRWLAPQVRTAER